MINTSEALNVAKQMEPYLNIESSIEFAGSKTAAPVVRVHGDGDLFFDSETNSIHLGVDGVIEIFSPATQEEFIDALEYVLRHEMGHRRFTAHKPYAWCIDEGVKAIIRYIAKEEEGKPHFFKDGDAYERYLEVELPKKGVYVPFAVLVQMVAGIANSLEDGRMERQVALQYPGFAAQLTKFRGIFWNRDNEYVEWSQCSKQDILYVLLNQVLSLATCQLYEKGFVMAYAGTPMMDEVRKFHQDIGMALLAPTCKEMMQPLVNVCEVLAPYIYEAAKMTASMAGARAMLQQILSKMIAAAIEANLDNPGGNLSEKEAETGELSNKTPFGASNLVVTLPDDVYDKLMANSENKEGEGGIQVRREHPLPEEKTDEKGDGADSRGTSTGATSEGNDGEENSEPSESADGTKSTSGGSEGSKPGESGDDSRSSGTDGTKSTSGGSEGSGESGKEQESSDSSTDDKSAANGSGKAKSSPESQKRSKQKPDGQDKGVCNPEEASSEMLAQVLSAMEEAAKQTKEDVAEAMENINSAVSHGGSGLSRAKRTESLSDSKPITEKDVKGFMKRSFREVFRRYKVQDKLPNGLQQRGNALYRKNEKFFRSKKKPKVPYLSSGHIDSKRITGLGLGKANVFCKNKVVDGFNGCAYVLMDNSGSMYGQKRIEAAKAGAVIEEGFYKMFPLKIVAFDENGAIIHEVVKDWNEWLKENCCWNYALHGRSGAGNEDGYDIEVATYELLKRPEQKKMLVILSDGAPGDRHHVARAVEAARKAGITVYSIYFEEGEVGEYGIRAMREMYKHDFVCCPLGELDKHLYKMFEKFSRS